MPGLVETLAELAASTRARHRTEPEGDLEPLVGFGPNPGALQMRLYLPPTLSAAAPLVVVLHGCGQTASGYASGAGWLTLADRYGFALLCAEQTRSNNANLCFNWFEADDVIRGRGEAASVAQMVRFAVARHGLDPVRVFVTGLSAGGAMTAAVLATYPEVFAAGAILAGLPYGVASGLHQAMQAMRRMPDLSAKAWGDKVRAGAPSPTRWPRLSIWHGEADATVTPAAADALVRQWCDVHGLREESHELTTREGDAHRSWRRPGGDVAVEFHLVSGLAHGTPIAASGEDGCGSPGPWILEAGLSSSLHIVRFWGIAETRYSDGRKPGATQHHRAGSASSRNAPARVNVAETITRSLRSAGLLP